MYRYETHLHTAPVSRCGKATVEETVRFYKDAGYAGIFVTNHFLNGNLNMEKTENYETRLNFYYSDYEAAKKLGEELGIAVFCAEEMSYKGTDFLIYGIDKQWYLEHPEILEMKTTELLTMLDESGALIIQAHPYMEAGYIDHIRLFPRHVHGVEILNGCKSDFVNAMAAHYAQAYDLIPVAGSDNHRGAGLARYAGLETDTPIADVRDFITRVKNRQMQIFCWEKE
ncbi:MAG: histidinol phosphatase [Ruminococcaceae bacterium]|nr:histidinol phosphatase [Oscillospiraceae bacterium]